MQSPSSTSHSGKGTLPFEWINKDASNITSKGHKKKANSHAQTVAWSLRKITHKSRKPSAPICQTQLPLHNTSIRTGDQQIVYDSELGGQSQDSGATATGSRSGSAFGLNDPASDSAHLLSEQLDPFMLLAGDTSRRERNLLHYCNSHSLL